MTHLHISQPGAALIRGHILVLALLYTLAFSPGSHAQDAARHPVAASPQTAAHSSRDKLMVLSGTSDELVQKLKSNQVDAAKFRIQVALYRESLRDLMLADQKAAAPEQLPRPVLMELVRMAALLQSAANCETGRYLVCPADLMERLVRQQTTVANAVNRPARSE